jgi:DNA repair protein RecO
MRHKYATEALVLGRTPISEESALITLLTRELGLVRVRAQGLRKPGAKLAAALQTLCETEVILVRGKDGWRLSGAVLTGNHFATMERPARLRAGRLAGLVLRLVAGEAAEPALYAALKGFLIHLATRPEAEHDAAECLAALRLLRLLGLDAGEPVSEAVESYSLEELSLVSTNRSAIITRINRGLAASGL